MKRIKINFAFLLASLLVYFGCKGEDKLASSYNKNTSSEAAEEVQVEGVWVIDSLTLPSVKVPSFCYQIGKGAAFEFTESDSLKIYPKDASEPCDTYSYTMQENFIQIIKGDMIMLVEYRLTAEKQLMLKSNTFFKWEEDAATDSSTYQTLPDEGINMFLSRK